MNDYNNLLSLTENTKHYTKQNNYIQTNLKNDAKDDR